MQDRGIILAMIILYYSHDSICSYIYLSYYCLCEFDFQPMETYPGVLNETFYDKICQWFSVLSAKKSDCHNITEILLKVVLNTFNP